MRRRDFIRTGALVGAAGTLMPSRLHADVQDHLWQGYNFGCPQVTNRLDQGPFGISQDEGWFTIFTTLPSSEHIRNFGTGLVATSEDFGIQGAIPSHPELLDWLATEFIKSGYSIKAMHRVMMNSEAYQRSSDDFTENVKVDPENKYLWRMPRVRLEAEVIRDQILNAAGNLNLTVGGPAVYPYIDPALYQSSSKRTWPGKSDEDTSTWRRSVYVATKRSIPLPMLDIFDKPDSVGSCPRRNRSTIAPQALIMMNNAFLLKEAQRFAERLQKEAGPDVNRQIDRAFALTLNRVPSQSERERSAAFIKGDANGLTDFCQALFNLNEFVYAP